MAKRTKIEDFQGFKTNIAKNIDKETKKVAKQCASDINREASRVLRPQQRNSKNYRGGWQTKTRRKVQVVYNRNFPQVSHLLEKTHTVWTKFGASNSQPKPHIFGVTSRSTAEYYDSSVENAVIFAEFEIF